MRSSPRFTAAALLAGVALIGALASAHAEEPRTPAALPSVSFAPTMADRVPTFDPSRLLVKFTVAAAVNARATGGAPTTALAARAHTLTKRPSQPVFGRWIAVDAGSGSDKVRTQLLASSAVATVSYDHWRQAQASDPLYRRYQQYLSQTMDFPQAWGRANGAGVTVAVIDSGVDRTHPDIGTVLRGRDLVGHDGRVTDPNGHGTFVSGIIAAIRGNHRGIAGASRATILPVRALNARGYGRDSTIARAIRWSVNHRADIINMSLGGSRSSRVLTDALRFAERNDVLVVASSGNGGGTKKSFPAAVPTVLAVGATDDIDRLTWFSQHGDWVDLVAPGWHIASTIPGNRYASGSGTSFSAPLVSAAAALLASDHPRWPVDRLRSSLTSATADTGPVGTDEFTGYGTVDVAGALGAQASWHGASSYGGRATTPATARSLNPGDTHMIAPEGGAPWYVYQRSSPAQVLVSAVARSDAAGVRRLNIVLEIYDEELHLIRRVDRHKGGQREETPVRLTNRIYARVVNSGPTRSPSAIQVRARYIGTTSKPTSGSGKRPVIVAATPSPNLLGHNPSVSLLVEVGRDLSPASVNAAHAIVTDGETGQRVARNVSYNPATNVVTIDPQQALASRRDYTVVLRGLRASNGAQLPDTRYGFRTS